MKTLYIPFERTENDHNQDLTDCFGVSSKIILQKLAKVHANNPTTDRWTPLIFDALEGDVFTSQELLFLLACGLMENFKRTMELQAMLQAAQEIFTNEEMVPDDQPKGLDDTD